MSLQDHPLIRSHARQRERAPHGHYHNGAFEPTTAHTGLPGLVLGTKVRLAARIRALLPSAAALRGGAGEHHHRHLAAIMQIGRLIAAAVETGATDEATEAAVLEAEDVLARLAVVGRLAEHRPTIEAALEQVGRFLAEVDPERTV